MPPAFAIFFCNLKGYVQADVAAADDENPGTVNELWGGCHETRVQHFVKIFTSYFRVGGSTASSVPVSASSPVDEGRRATLRN